MGQVSLRTLWSSPVRIILSGSILIHLSSMLYNLINQQHGLINLVVDTAGGKEAEGV